MKERARIFLAFFAIAIWAGSAAGAEDACNTGSFASTYALIQSVIFERHGCTNDVCHGFARQGGLDLRSEHSYDELVEVEARTVAGQKRVVPGRRDASLLFTNVAAKTLPNQYRAPIRPMPPDPLPALSLGELELLRRWIEAGAPREGTVPGTGELVDACLPPPKPISIRPLDPPPAGRGIQLRMPAWTIAPHSEREVCFATYYDVTDQVPEKYRAYRQFLGREGVTFRYWRNEVRQDPLSHHLIVNLYLGNAGPDDPVWGTFRCRGGSRDGELCRPTDTQFCGSGICASDPQDAVGCIGFGPADSNTGINRAGFSGGQETATEFRLPPGVYAEIPTRGIIIWNSHAFNLTDEPGKLEAWLNFEFVEPEQQQSFAQPIFDGKDIFKMTEVPPYTTKEVCSHHELPKGARLFELSSHGHKRMKRWRTFEGRWACAGGPANGQPCEPLGYDYASPDVCAGYPCQSWKRQRAGDCNEDGAVTIDELVSSVALALADAPSDNCADADLNDDERITVEEIVRAVVAALNGVPDPEPRDPEESLLYVNLLYNDPLVLRFDPPRRYSAATPSERTLTYCALYDNGFINPAEVKRKSTAPRPLVPGLGGCPVATHCAEGRVGAPCSGAGTEQRHRSCDSSPDAGDGLCDACPLRGGVTTDDEMFVLLGIYYVPGVQEPILE